MFAYFCVIFISVSHCALALLPLVNSSYLLSLPPFYGLIMCARRVLLYQRAYFGREMFYERCLSTLRHNIYSVFKFQGRVPIYIIGTNSAIWKCLRICTHNIIIASRIYQKGGVLKPIRIIIPANCTSSPSKLLLIRFPTLLAFDAKLK